MCSGCVHQIARCTEERNADQHHHQRPAAAAQQPQRNGRDEHEHRPDDDDVAERLALAGQLAYAASEKVVAARAGPPGSPGIEQLQDDDDPDAQRAGSLLHWVNSSWPG